MISDNLDVDYHYRETVDMRMEKADADFFYNFRHLKQFKKMVKQNDTVWSFQWHDGNEIEIINKLTGDVLFKCGHNPHFAEYVCSLHNMSSRMIKEVESKYE